MTVESTTGTESGAHVAAQLGTSGVGISGDLSSGSSGDDRFTERFTEIYRETVIFFEVATRLDSALTALGLDRLLVLIDEWTAIPSDLQPYVAEFIKRALLTSPRMTIKIASLEYRSRFSVQVGDNNIVGFEVGPDIAANLDLDDYYVYERNREQVTASFLELLYQHLRAELPEN